MLGDHGDHKRGVQEHEDRAGLPRLCKPL